MLPLNPEARKIADSWASANGATVKVVTKDFGSILSNLATVAAADAPDVILAAHDWTGELSANGSVLPLSPSAATKKQFPAYALNAFSYGTAIKKLYAAPVALENIALFTNTKRSKVPTSFADLERQALAAKKKTKAQVGLAVQQGATGDAYHMYPFFSGLGGYIFGTNRAGNLDPSDIGVANAKFLKNAAVIDRWNKEGLIRSQVSGLRKMTDQAIATGVDDRPQASAVPRTSGISTSRNNRSGRTLRMISRASSALPASPTIDTSPAASSS